jgi:hypothetical protein
MHDPDEGYTVRGAYNLFTLRDAPEAVSTSDLIWHKQVPLKASVLAWRLLRNRLPTRDNLVRHHIIAQNAHFCMTLWGSGNSATLVIHLPNFHSSLGFGSKLGWYILG